MLSIRSQSDRDVAAPQVLSGFWRISSPLGVSLYFTSVGFSGGDDSDPPLPLGVDDNEEFPLDLTVETKPIFAVGNPKSKPRSWKVCWLLLSSHSNSNGGKGSADNHSELQLWMQSRATFAAFLQPEPWRKGSRGLGLGLQPVRGLLRVEPRWRQAAE